MYKVLTNLCHLYASSSSIWLALEDIDPYKSNDSCLSYPVQPTMLAAIIIEFALVE